MFRLELSQGRSLCLHWNMLHNCFMPTLEQQQQWSYFQTGHLTLGTHPRTLFFIDNNFCLLNFCLVLVYPENIASHSSIPVRKDDDCKADMEEDDDTKVKKQEGHFVWVLLSCVKCVSSPVNKGKRSLPITLEPNLWNISQNFTRKWQWCWRWHSRAGWWWWSRICKHVSWCNLKGLPLQAPVHVHGTFKGFAGSCHWILWFYQLCFF